MHVNYTYTAVQIHTMMLVWNYARLKKHRHLTQGRRRLQRWNRDRSAKKSWQTRTMLNPKRRLWRWNSCIHQTTFRPQLHCLQFLHRCILSHLVLVQIAIQVQVCVLLDRTLYVGRWLRGKQLKSNHVKQVCSTWTSRNDLVLQCQFGCLVSSVSQRIYVFWWCVKWRNRRLLACSMPLFTSSSPR